MSLNERFHIPVCAAQGLFNIFYIYFLILLVHKKMAVVHRSSSFLHLNVNIFISPTWLVMKTLIL